MRLFLTFIMHLLVDIFLGIQWTLQYTCSVINVLFLNVGE